MSKKLVSKGARLGDYRPPQSQVKQQKPKKPSSQIHGFKLNFEKKPTHYQQQQESDLHDQQDHHEQQDTPINMLHVNSSSEEIIQRVDQEIKTISSQIIVPEDIDNNFPFDIIEASIAKSSLKKEGVQSLSLERNWGKQEQFTQSLFIKILQQNDESILQILKIQRQQSYPLKLIYSFFQFKKIMTKIALNQGLSRGQQANSQLQQLNKYICQKILTIGRQRRENLKIENFPEIFLIFITETQQKYINRLLSSNKIQRALAVANFQDKAFLNFPSRYASSNFQLQLTCMREKDLDLLKNSVWLLQLGVVTNIFKSKNIYEYGQLIIQRQLQFKDHILPSQFLVFCLQWSKLSKQNRLQNSSFFEIKDQDIQKLVKLILQSEYYELWQFFIILKAQLLNYPKPFKMVLQNLIRKLKKPTSFLQLISLSQINPNQIASYFKLYISQNENIKANSSIINDLKKCISDSLAQKKNYNVALKLTQWVNFTQLEKLFKRGDYEQYLIKMLQQYQRLQKSEFVNLDELLDKMILAITDFKICCNYKFGKRKQIYRILGELQKKLTPSQQKYLDIIQGCRSFIQLRQGIFCLNEQGKLKSIDYVYNYLQQQAKRLEKQDDKTRRQNVKRVIKIIEDTLLKMLQTHAGKIYLSELCRQMEKQKEVLFQPGGIEMLLSQKGTNFSILMQVLGQDKKILNYAALLVGFS